MAHTLFDLRGKVTLVTGGNSGLGRGFARGVAKQGGDVIVWGRSDARNEETRKELAAFGVRVAVRSVDVTDEKAVVDGFAAALKDFGRLDCVFANAGAPAAPAQIVDMATEAYNETLTTNMHSVFFTLREAGTHMRERAKAGDPGGSLVVTGSLANYAGLAGGGHYAVAKSGIAALIRTLAVELGPYGVRANILTAGYLKTEGLEKLGDLTEVDKFYSKKSPLGRVGHVRDVEGLAAYLVSDASAYHTGDNIIIDGGIFVNAF